MMPLSNGSVSTATSSGVPSVLLQRDPHLLFLWEAGGEGGRNGYHNSAPLREELQTMACCHGSRLSSFLNGSRLAHLPAIRDDRARPGVRLVAAPQTERQTQNTRSWTSVALKNENFYN
ncbi:hypothetical protein XENOCAPTIV_020337 [Xenoophorus captivus]|uniref:Uncharacterized protein n=1 Tax=Xenoophorus captivus TaxID=1517983 RepID=A0ABV0RIB3_9TELE